jgi:putative ABC transport system permease protein
MFYGAAQPGDKVGAFKGNQMFISPEFLETYDIPLLAGRNLSRSFTNDNIRHEGFEPLSESINVLVNELVLDHLGIASPEQAIGQPMFDMNEGDPIKEYIIVGVVPTQNINGLSNQEVPWMFSLYLFPQTLSLRIEPGNFVEAIDDIEEVWKEVVPNYPMRGRFLDDVFDENYRLFGLISQILMIFALIALFLAVTGLFGLASFITEQKTREIGVRKVLGASSVQIAKLLIWQISIPIIWALCLGLPAAFFASSQYLNIFPDPIKSQFLILLVAGAISVLLGWITVAGRVYSVARANPIHALRHE